MENGARQTQDHGVIQHRVVRGFERAADEMHRNARRNLATTRQQGIRAGFHQKLRLRNRVALRGERERAARRIERELPALREAGDFHAAELPGERPEVEEIENRAGLRREAIDEIQLQDSAERELAGDDEMIAVDRIQPRNFHLQSAAGLLQKISDDRKRAG